MRRRHITPLLISVLFALANLSSLSAQIQTPPSEQTLVNLSSSQVNQAFRNMRDRREATRERALETLSLAANDLSRFINRELETGHPMRVRNALKVIQVKQAYIECADMFALLTSDDRSIADQTVATLRTFDHTQLTSLHERLDASDLSQKERAQVRSILEHESRYAAAYAIAALVSAPGHFDGQYSELLAAGDWVVSALGDVIMLSEEIESPLQQAVMDFAERARHLEQVDANLIRLLAHGIEIPKVIPILRGSNNATISNRPMHYAAEIVSRMRNRSARALGSSPSNQAALAVLQTGHALLSELEQDTSFDTEISLIEEIEVSMACLGIQTHLQRRFAALRLVESIHEDIDLPALGLANNNDMVAIRGLAEMSFPEDEVHPDIRKKVAYLHLRAGQLDQAILEYTLLINQLERDASQFNGDVAVSAYNLACAYARKGLASEAFEHLKHAVAFGYDTYHHYEWMLLDGDISSVRATQEFADWFKEVAPPFLLRQFQNAQGIEASDSE